MVLIRSRALPLFALLASFLLGACEERIYKPPVNNGALDAAGGTFGADAGAGMDFGYAPPDVPGPGTTDTAPVKPARRPAHPHRPHLRRRQGRGPPRPATT
jgi:hypothetical protein